MRPNWTLENKTTQAVLHYSISGTGYLWRQGIWNPKT